MPCGMMPWSAVGPWDITKHYETDYDKNSEEDHGYPGAMLVDPVCGEQEQKWHGKYHPAQSGAYSTVVPGFQSQEQEACYYRDSCGQSLCEPAAPFDNSPQNTPK